VLFNKHPFKRVTWTLLTPNAPLTSRRCILNIYSTNIRTEYFKHCTRWRCFSCNFKICLKSKNTRLYESFMIAWSSNTGKYVVTGQNSLYGQRVSEKEQASIKRREGNRKLHRVSIWQKMGTRVKEGTEWIRVRKRIK
jgi:hypothetical protein